MGQLGYTEVSRSTQQKHLDDDLELSLRGLSLNEVVQPANDVAGTGSNALGETTPETTPEEVAAQGSENGVHSLVFQLNSILDEYERRLKSSVHLVERFDNVDGSTGGNNDAALLQEHISWMTATMSNLKVLPVGQRAGLDQQRDSMVHMIQDKLQSIRKWEELHYDESRSQSENTIGGLFKHGEWNEKYNALLLSHFEIR